MSEGQTREPVINLGVSTCLLGETVRFDGGHKLDRYLVNTLGQFVNWVPVCPEVEIGLPTPRESLRLIGEADRPRLVAPRSGTDHTETMQSWARNRLEELATVPIHGFIFKKDSPSSGLYRVRVYNPAGIPQRNGTGIFPAEVMRRLPLLPVEEEGRLHDMTLRENFIERMFAYHRWLTLLEQDPSPHGLVRFHTAHKLTLMSHSPSHYRQLGCLVAQAGALQWDDLAAEYANNFMEALAIHTSPGKHVNTIQHLMSFLKGHLGPADKAELLGLLEDYRQGLVPLIVPLTLLKHHLNRHPVPDWAHQQVYLHPYPKELMLRNHV